MPDPQEHAPVRLGGALPAQRGQPSLGLFLVLQHAALQLPHVPCIGSVHQDGVDEAFAEARYRHRGHQLQLGQPADDLRAGHNMADAQRRRQRLREAADVDAVLQPRQLHQCLPALGMEVPIDIVLHHQKAVLGSPLHHPESRARRQRASGGVVKGAVADEEPAGLPILQRLIQRLQVRPVGVAPHPHGRAPGQPHQAHQGTVAGLVHQHPVARAYQKADHQIQRLGGAHRRQQLLGRHVDARGAAQMYRQLMAQRHMPLDVPIIRQRPLPHPRRLAHACRQCLGVPPFRRQPATAQLQIFRPRLQQPEQGRLPGWRGVLRYGGPVRRRGRQTFGRRRHVVPAPMLHLQQPLADQLRISAGHGVQAELLPLRHLPQ